MNTKTNTSVVANKNKNTCNYNNATNSITSSKMISLTEETDV